MAIPQVEGQSSVRGTSLLPEETYREERTAPREEPLTSGAGMSLFLIQIANDRDGIHLEYREADYLYSVAYLRAISLTCSRVSCFGGPPGGRQVSRKKPSKPGGAMIQSR